MQSGPVKGLLPMIEVTPTQGPYPNSSQLSRVRTVPAWPGARVTGFLPARNRTILAAMRRTSSRRFPMSRIPSITLGRHFGRVAIVLGVFGAAALADDFAPKSD